MEREFKHFWNEFVQEAFGKNPDLVRFFRDHERAPLARRRMLGELKKCEKKLGRKFTRERLRAVTRDLAAMFCQNCIDAQNYKLSSAATKGLIGRHEAELTNFQDELTREVAALERGSYSKAGGYGFQEVRSEVRSLPKGKAK